MFVFLAFPLWEAFWLNATKFLMADRLGGEIQKVGTTR